MSKRVFVSSTCHDLIDARAELEATIRDLGLLPVLSDRPTSEFEVNPTIDSISSCVANVNSADFVIVLIDRRYGPPMKEGPHQGMSATHIEVRRAVEAKKHIYYFVRDRFLFDLEILKAGGLEGCKWIQKKDGESLVRLFEEVKALRHGGPSNWYDTFTSSVDLKARVRQRLGRTSRREQVVEMINSNSLPTLLCMMGNIPGVTTHDDWVDIPIVYLSHRGDIYDLEIMQDNIQQVTLGFIAEDHRQQFMLKCRTKYETLLRATYYTIEGHKVEEEWMVVIFEWRKVVSLVKRTVTPGSRSRIQIKDEA